MRRLVSAILLLGASASSFSVAEVPFNGKSGDALLQAVASSCRPARTADKSQLTFEMTDEFTGRRITVTAGVLPDGYVWSTFVPAVWWSNSSATYGSFVSDDIFNLLPVTEEVIANRRDLVPGDVATPTFSNKFWSAGRTTLYGVETELYSPPVALRGELARAFFYMATVYHVGLWTPRAYLMMDGKAYPGLTDYAVPLLLEWHRAAAPSAREIEKNRQGETLQGNRNPFADYPDLPEYLWGKHKGEKFIIEGEPQPLRGVYTMADGHVDLYYPEIPSDAVWSVDGIPVSSASVAVRDLGVGLHTLSYHSPSTREKGKLMIRISK